MEKKNENLKYILTRYDNYVNASNVKGSFLVTLNTFIVGCILVNKNGISDLLNENIYFIKAFNIVLYLICISALGMLFFTIKALFPYTDSGNSSIEKYHSHIFFGSVCTFTSSKLFEESFSELDDNDFEQDLSNQIYTISKGLTKKYKMLHYAMYLVYLELTLFIITLILILF